MELMTKYQYTYFIHPYIIDENKYDKYIYKLLKDKKCSYKIFEKEKDLDIYNFFLPNIRSFMFPSFELRGEKFKNFNSLDIEKKKNKIVKRNVACFTYNLASDIQGKVGTENGIFFKIEGIEIICFNTGICFFTMKTHIENTNRFIDVLDFNYRFKGINSEFASLKDFENIRIQTDTFKDMKDLSELINQITGINTKQKNNSKESLINSQFYTYSYACVETSNWNEKTDFFNIENDFLKFANVLPSNYNSDFNRANIEHNLHIIEKLKYVKTTISNMSSNLMCSGIDTYNYTKLPYEYENQYFYLYILGLYKRLFLMKLNNDFKEYDKIVRMRKKFINFTKEIWNKDITLDDTGMLYTKTLNRTLELEELYNEIQNKYEVIYKQLNIEKNNVYYSVIVILLIFSLIFNTINIIFLMYLLS
ncbi:MAG TPA: hypothetical protein IAD08_03310 [Candidatus Scatovivens faecipullorum]|nr:hypothetical protein [Candidatus Scatovivens faecipullorum]